MLEVFMGFLTILNLCPKPISWHQFFFDVLAEGFCHLEANWNSKQFSLQMLWGDLLQIMDVIYFWPCIFFFFFEQGGVIKWLNICALCCLTKQLASYAALISCYYEKHSSDLTCFHLCILKRDGHDVSCYRSLSVFVFCVRVFYVFRHCLKCIKNDNSLFVCLFF